MDFYAEQILTIAFDESGDIVIEQDGNRSKAVANHAKVQRDRLKVDSLKWITSACSLSATATKRSYWARRHGR